MKILKGFLLLFILGVMSTPVYATGNVEKGRKLFNDPNLGGSENTTSCATCHPNGKGLAGVGQKREWNTPAGSGHTLAGTVNQCITMALKGKALDPKSQEMQDIIAYLDSLK